MHTHNTENRTQDTTYMQHTEEEREQHTENREQNTDNREQYTQDKSQPQQRTVHTIIVHIV